MASIDNIVGVLAIHSYGQMYMVSYGYTEDPNPDYDEQMIVCNEAIDALRAVHGQTYRCDSLIPLVGPNAGSAVDYQSPLGPRRRARFDRTDIGARQGQDRHCDWRVYGREQQLRGQTGPLPFHQQHSRNTRGATKLGCQAPG